MSQKKTLVEFQDQLDRHGPRLEEWPAEAREAAEALLTSDPAAQTLLEQARGLEAAFHSLPRPRAPKRLTDTVLAAVEADPAVVAGKAVTGAERRLRTPPFSIFTLCLLAGLAAGLLAHGGTGAGNGAASTTAAASADITTLMLVY